MALFDKKPDDKAKVPDLPKPPAYMPSQSNSPSLPTPPSFSPTSSTPKLPDLTPLPSDVPAPKLSGPSDIPAPSGPENHTELMTEDIEKIVESVLEEKSGKLKDELSNLTSWKEDLTKQVGDFKKQLDELNQKMNDTQNAMLGKVEEYNKSLGDVNVEIQAMGKVFQKLIPEFTENVKKLSDTVNKK